MDGDGLGVLKYLPDDELRMVLRYLKFVDIGNMRCVSKGLKRHVTNLTKSQLFNTFHVKGINKYNSEGISRTLSIAMAEVQSPKMLQLEFEDELTPVMRLMLLDYMELIISLAIQVMGNNQELLLRQSTFFESLESLRLYCPFDQNDGNIVGVCEAMLAKHAHNLKYLKVVELRKNLSKNLNVPALPVIDSLVLLYVEDEEAVYSLYEQSRNTLTSFTIVETDIRLSKSAAFQIQNLKHLRLACDGNNNEINYVLLNSNNLVSLDLEIAEDIPADIEWPEFSALRELCIAWKMELLTIISKSKDTLEQLIIHGVSSADSEYAVEMPRLTDLYIIRVNHEFINKIFRLNCKNLEFLYLYDIDLSDLDFETIRMNKVEILMIDAGTNPSEEEMVKMAVMFPYAEIVVFGKENRLKVIKLARGRRKQRRFALDTERVIDSYFIFI